MNDIGQVKGIAKPGTRYKQRETHASARNKIQRTIDTDDENKHGQTWMALVQATHKHTNNTVNQSLSQEYEVSPLYLQLKENTTKIKDSFEPGIKFPSTRTVIPVYRTV